MVETENAFHYLLYIALYKSVEWNSQPQMTIFHVPRKQNTVLPSLHTIIWLPCHPFSYLAVFS